MKVINAVLGIIFATWVIGAIWGFWSTEILGDGGVWFKVIVTLGMWHSAFSSLGAAFPNEHNPVPTIYR